MPSWGFDPRDSSLAASAFEFDDRAEIRLGRWTFRGSIAVKHLSSTASRCSTFRALLHSVVPFEHCYTVEVSFEHCLHRDSSRGIRPGWWTFRGSATVKHLSSTASQVQYLSSTAAQCSTFRALLHSGGTFRALPPHGTSFGVSPGCVHGRPKNGKNHSRGAFGGPKAYGPLNRQSWNEACFQAHGGIKILFF